MNKAAYGIIVIIALYLLFEYFNKKGLLIASGIIWFAKDEFDNVYLASDITPIMFSFLDKRTSAPFENIDEAYSIMLA